MKIISWNVNSMRSRWDDISKLLTDEQPDILMMQETKCAYADLDNEFLTQLHNRGYSLQLSSHSSAGRHGVGMLVKNTVPFNGSYVIVPGRVHGILVDGTLYVNVYINNGQEIGAEEYENKFGTIQTLKDWINFERSGPGIKNVVIAGDFNITKDDTQVWSTAHWHAGVITCSPREREALHDLMNELKLTMLSIINFVKFSWYGYRQCWRKYKNGKLHEHTGNYGICVDHILTDIVSENKVELLEEYRIPAIQRETATSDHLPLMWTI